MNPTLVPGGAGEAEIARFVAEWLEHLESRTKRNLSAVARILDIPTGAGRQLEVYRETNSTYEVAHDIAERTRASVET